MVTNAILSIIGSVIAWVLGILPSFGVPSWLSSAGSYVSTVTGYLSGLSAWLPWNYLLLAVGVVVGAYAVSVAIRGIRIAASFLTLGGGA